MPQKLYLSKPTGALPSILTYLLKLLNNRKVSAAADFFLKYVFADGQKLKGLVRRSNAERDLFLAK
ncbi:MAG TPA: hypothetical protein PKY82_05675 [Pyrinomonadaceae bacterium]|nr:hypothetical protein [Pyrinomonadaceae bacterium]